MQKTVSVQSSSPRRPCRGPRWPQDGQRRLQDDPSCFEDGPRRLHDASRRPTPADPYDGHQWSWPFRPWSFGPIGFHVGPNLAQEAHKKASRRRRGGPLWPPRRPRWPKMVPPPLPTMTRYRMLSLALVLFSCNGPETSLARCRMLSLVLAMGACVHGG